MIVIPALAGILAILEPIIVGAVIGAAASGAICAAGGAVSEIHDRGTPINVVQSAGNSIVACAEEGSLTEAALIGGAFGGVAHVAAPALNTVGSAAKPVLAAADDVVGPAMRSVGSALDDVARGIGSAVDDVGARLGIVSNGARNAQQIKNMPQHFCRNGCNYTMFDDVSGATKPGITTRHPSLRRAEVSRDVGRPVSYRSIHPGNNLKQVRQTERAIHQTFASQRNVSMPGREWFDLNPIDQLSVRAWAFLNKQQLTQLEGQ